MKPREIMSALVDHEETMIDAVALSLRNIKFGRGEFAFFENNMDLVATLSFLVGLLEEDTSNIWNALTQVNNDYKDSEEVNQDALARLEIAVSNEIKTALNLLANIVKAKESVEFQEIWKEKQNEKTLHQRTDERKD